MQEMQFSMLLLMSLLTVTLIMLIPRRVAGNDIINRSRWLMAAGTTLIAIQFLLQYSLRLRDMGITQPVMINLLFFIPCSSLLSIAILNLQQQGRAGFRPLLYGLLTWAASIVLIVGAALIDGVPLLEDTREMRIAEYISAVLYSLMQVYYTISLNRGNRELGRALSNYFDYDTSDMLRWMRRSVFLMAIVGVGAPFFIFSTRLVVLIYGLVIMSSIYYLVICFICYCVSNDSRKVFEASENAAKAKMNDAGILAELSDDEKQRIEKVVGEWIETGGYLHRGITMHDAARDMHLPRYQLAAWLKTTEWDLFNPWLSYLRIEKAKSLLREHPDWGNDTIAQQCGFSSRSYFQQVFKKYENMTPAQFAQQK